MVRSMRDSDWPYGRIAYHFDYRPEDHDDGEKTFLGHTGNFNGEDIIAIICRQESTARFISRHLYHFFVADEPPVPAWPYTPPRDPEAIDILVRAYFDSDYDIRAVLRALFNSDFFKSDDARYRKVKGPAEFLVSVLRMTGEFDIPRRDMIPRYRQTVWMGQELSNPPSVEGWHEGSEWIDTGTLVERINFASEQFGDADKPGVSAMIDRICREDTGRLSSKLSWIVAWTRWARLRCPTRHAILLSISPGMNAVVRASRTCSDFRPPPKSSSWPSIMLEYWQTIGIVAMEGRGFEYPTDTVAARNGRLYVPNRSRDFGERGVRVTIFDLDSEYYGNLRTPWR